MKPKNSNKFLKNLLLVAALLAILTQKSAQQFDYDDEEEQGEGSGIEAKLPFCYRGTADECWECDGGYYLTNKNTKCTKFSTKNCEKCDSVGCRVCERSHFDVPAVTSLTPQGYVECNPCLKGCETCENETVCIECEHFHKKLEEGTVCKKNVLLYVIFVFLTILGCLICCGLTAGGVYCCLKQTRMNNIRKEKKEQALSISSVRPASGLTNTSRFTPAPYGGSFNGATHGV